MPYFWHPLAFFQVSHRRKILHSMNRRDSQYDKGGSDMLMSGPVPVELGSSIGGGAQGTAIGIISGLGTMGAVAQGPIAGLIAQLGSILH